MTLQTIDAANPNFPMTLFTIEEEAGESPESNWIPLFCCDYQEYEFDIELKSDFSDPATLQNEVFW